MNADYLKLTPGQRLYLALRMKGMPSEQALEKIPDATNPKKIGISPDAISKWRQRDAEFVKAEQRYMENPQLFHKEVIAPLMLAEQDATYLEGMMGLGPKVRLTSKERELVLLENGHLTPDEDPLSKVLFDLAKNRSYEQSQPPQLPERSTIDLDAVAVTTIRRG